jgi:uncharacterized protein
MQQTTERTVWYREPWPWIVMAGPALAVIGSLVSTYLAVHGADPVVDENYYEHGLQINRELARAQQASHIQLQADLQMTGVHRGDEVRVHLMANEQLRDSAIRIRLINPIGEFSERTAVLGRVPGSSVARFYGQWLQAPDDRLSLDRGSWRAVIEGDDWKIEGPAGADVHWDAP